jgi:hypothetical protein
MSKPTVALRLAAAVEAVARGAGKNERMTSSGGGDTVHPTAHLRCLECNGVTKLGVMTESLLLVFSPRLRSVPTAHRVNHMRRRDLLRLLEALRPRRRGWLHAHVSDPPKSSAIDPQTAPRPTPGAFDVDLVLTAAPAEMPLLLGAPTRVWRFTGEQLAGPAGHADDAGRLVPRAGHPSSPRAARPHPLPATASARTRSCTGTASTCRRTRTAIRASRSVPAGVRVRVHRHQPRGHLLVPPASPHAHRRAGVLTAWPACCSSAIPRRTRSPCPRADRELLCVLQDRVLRHQNQLLYQGTMMEMMNGVLGDRMIVSGRLRQRARWTRRGIACAC